MGAALTIVFGAGLAVMGLAVLTDAGGFGTRMIKSYVPKTLQVGTLQTYRKRLGAGYVLAGAVLAVIGAVLALHK